MRPVEIQGRCCHDNQPHTLSLSLPPPSVSLCSEKPLSLQILLTDRSGDQSAVSQDHQAPPLHPSRAGPASSPENPTGSPSENSRAGGAVLALCDTCGQSPLEDLAPPSPPEEAGLSTQGAEAPPAPTPPPPWPCSRSTPPVKTSHLMMDAEPYYSTQPLTTPPAASPTPRLAPPPSTHWSCYHLDSPDAVDFPDPPTYTPQTCSPRPHQDHGSALPVERWAQNVNRYYGGGEGAEPCEELSELDSLYQASLRAPSMHRGHHGVSPLPGNKPGEATGDVESHDLTQVRGQRAPVLSCVCVGVRTPSASGRSKTPTAEMERFVYRTPEVHQCVCVCVWSHRCTVQSDL